MSTYIPDSSVNMAHVVSHLNLLLQTQHSGVSAESWGFDMWAWPTSGSWSFMLLGVWTLITLVLFYIFPLVVSYDARNVDNFLYAFPYSV